MEEKDTYDSEEEFRQTAHFVWQRYLDSLSPGEEPKHDMKFYGVIKQADNKFIVACVTHNPSKPR
jgi:hypothetical protein